MEKFYFITDRKKFKKGFIDQIKTVLDKGVRVIQIREKDISDIELFTLTQQVIEIAKGYDVKILINSRVDIAVLLNLYGVHIPENGIPVRYIKQKFPNLIVGKSCHSIEGALMAQEDGADYIFFSPIFKVEGKGEPIGIDGLREVLKLIKIPVYALGGINSGNIKQVLDTGVYGVAGVRFFIEE